jgi:hypothetical protein
MLQRSILLITAMLCSQLASADARVTVAHFAPFAEDIDATSVSIALNGTVALENVKFKDFTDYIPLPAGEYTVDIIPTGTSTVAITATYTLEDGKDYTVYASGNGTLQPLELFALADDNTAPAMGNVKVRVVHTAPFAATLEGTEVSIRTAGGDLVAGLQGVPYGVASGYLELPTNTYDLKVASNNGQVNYIDPLPVDLPSGAIVTLFAVGDIVNQDLAIIATPITELPLRAPVDQTVSGAFKLDGFDGEGFFLTPVPSQNRLTGSWYTYNADGSAQWFTFDSCLDDTNGCSTPGGFDGTSALTTLYQSTGATPGGDMQMTVPVGTIEFNVVSCDLIGTTVTVGESVAFFDGVRLTPSALCPPAVATPVSN